MNKIKFVFISIILSIFFISFINIDVISAENSKTIQNNDPTIIPQNLRVPALAFNEKSIVLVWNKPDNYQDIMDYNVYMNGVLIGSTNANNDKNSPAKAYIDKFYSDDKENFHIKISIHTFTVGDLLPNTNYSFTVRSVLKNNAESADSNKIIQKTTDIQKIINIKDFGAKGDGKTINTNAIQKAINNCPKGGKVLVPEGIFKTGAIFLKSNITLEIAENGVILGSENPEDYPLKKGYRLYSYLTNDRPPSLINAISQRNKGSNAFKNIRITGRGIIDGNGWEKIPDLFTIDEIGNKIPQYIPSNRRKVQSDGILAKNQVIQAVNEGLDIKTAYGQRRSSLITLRGVTNVYYEGITILNPAFHGIMNLECDNITLNSVIFYTYDTNNGDGVEFGNSDGATVFNCFFDTGDDCVNFASGVGIESLKQRPMQNAWIFNNYFRNGHGAVVCGSHTGAWIQKILAEDNIINYTDVGLRCKSSTINGGGAKDILFRDNSIKNVGKQAFVFTTGYSDPNAALDYTPAKTPGIFKDILIKNVTVQTSRGRDYSIEIEGNESMNAYHENINFENVSLIDVNAASINGLKNSYFNKIRFLKINGDINPWIITNSDGLVFKNTTGK